MPGLKIYNLILRGFKIQLTRRPKMKKVIMYILVITFATNLSAKNKKIFISADLEGVVGAVTGEQLGPGGFEYNRFREFMTAEVNAAIAAAKAGGATEILVADSHGNGQNLLIEKLQI